MVWHAPLPPSPPCAHQDGRQHQRDQARADDRRPRPAPQRWLPLRARCRPPDQLAGARPVPGPRRGERDGHGAAAVHTNESTRTSPIRTPSTSRPRRPRPRPDHRVRRPRPARPWRWVAVPVEGTSRPPDPHHRWLREPTTWSRAAAAETAAADVQTELGEVGGLRVAAGIRRRGGQSVSTTLSGSGSSRVSSTRAGTATGDDKHEANHRPQPAKRPGGEPQRVARPRCTQRMRTVRPDGDPFGAGSVLMAS